CRRLACGASRLIAAGPGPSKLRRCADRWYPSPHVGWAAAPAGTGRGVPVARGVAAALPPLPPGDARPPAAAPRAARPGEARVRLSALRHIVRLEDRAAPAQGAVANTMSAHAHRARHRRSVGCAVVTVSDTRTEADDASGARMRALLEQAGHRVVAYAIL